MDAMHPAKRTQDGETIYESWGKLATVNSSHFTWQHFWPLDKKLILFYQIACKVY